MASTGAFSPAAAAPPACRHRLLRLGRGLFGHLLLHGRSFLLRFAFLPYDHDHAADRDLVAFLELQVLDGARDRRRQLDDGLVGLDLGDGIVFFHVVALLHDPLLDLAGRYSLSQVGELELECHSITLCTNFNDYIQIRYSSTAYRTTMATSTHYFHCTDDKLKNYTTIIFDRVISSKTITKDDKQPIIVFVLSLRKMSRGRGCKYYHYLII